MIHKTQLNVHTTADLELEELLGTTIENDGEWVDMNVILNHVTAYRERYVSDVLKPDQCTIYLHGDTHGINTPYKVFDKLMQDFYGQKR